jgi:hypothetical protein
MRPFILVPEVTRVNVTDPRVALCLCSCSLNVSTRCRRESGQEKGRRRHWAVSMSNCWNHHHDFHNCRTLHSGWTLALGLR